MNSREQKIERIRDLLACLPPDGLRMALALMNALTDAYLGRMALAADKSWRALDFYSRPAGEARHYEVLQWLVAHGYLAPCAGMYVCLN